jgi:hypothetical protein
MEPQAHAWHGRAHDSIRICGAFLLNSGMVNASKFLARQSPRFAAWLVLLRSRSPFLAAGSVLTIRFAACKSKHSRAAMCR